MYHCAFPNAPGTRHRDCQAPSKAGRRNGNRGTDEVDNLLEDQDLSFKRARNHLRQYLVLSEKEKQILREDFAQLGISLPEARLE